MLVLPRHNATAATIVDAIREGRRIGANIVKFVCHLMAGKNKGGRARGRAEIVVRAPKNPPL